MSKKHYLKIATEFFVPVALGLKNFEVRVNDRGFCIGDIIVLQEYRDGQYTGRELERLIVYILDDPRFCKEGFVVFSFIPLKR